MRIRPSSWNIYKLGSAKQLSQFFKETKSIHSCHAHRDWLNLCSVFFDFHTLCLKPGMMNPRDCSMYTPFIIYPFRKAYFTSMCKISQPCWTTSDTQDNGLCSTLQQEQKFLENPRHRNNWFKNLKKRWIKA
jgi:hypothetical protein